MFIPAISLVLLSYAIAVNGLLCSWKIGASISIGMRCDITAGTLHFRDDGNPVVTNVNGQTVWQTNTSGTGYLLNFQSDGNLVIVSQDGKVVWNLGMSGNGATVLTFQYDRNLVLRDKDGNGVWDARSHMNSEEYYDAIVKLETSSENAQQQLTSAEQQLTSAQQQLTSAQQQLTSAEQQLTSSQQQLTSSQQQLTSAQNQLTSARNHGIWLMQQLSTCWTEC